MSTQYSIEDWESIVKHFKTLFDGMGEIDHTNKSIRFSSVKPDVMTSISINKNGSFDASMPLHGAEGIVEKVSFSKSNVIMTGQNLNYTYRIPPEILSKRISD
ncbi:MAG: hypothetical protein CMA22_00670 [Euryarchaeota archaeon]|nr:hypothetical protein [Euryarchaeota archaeon]|tara:strand:- start:3390 stop:3698 length:309 start_codon:yes stop_codon:yes gene_type:complete